jgi:hypothetical protein
LLHEKGELFDSVGAYRIASGILFILLQRLVARYLAIGLSILTSRVGAQAGDFPASDRLGSGQSYPPSK